MAGFLETLRIQRWDDHRYYHHSRINQSLHLVERVQLPVAYVLLFKDPRGRAVRLAGGDDQPADRPLLLRAEGLRRVNQATHEYKEADQGRLQPAPQGRAAGDLGAVAAGLCRSDAVRPVPRQRRKSGFVRHVGDTLAGVGHRRRCSSAPSSCSSSGTCRPGWCGRPRSSPTRSTTSSCTTGRRCSLLRRPDRIGTDGDEHELRAQRNCASAERKARSRRRFSDRGQRGGERCAIISRRIAAPDRSCWWSLRSRHHQPSRCIAVAGGDEALGHGGEIGVGVVQAEDQAAGADPAQRQPLGAQVVLQHPVVARRLACSRRSRSRTGWRPAPAAPLAASRALSRCGALVPDVVEVRVERLDLGRLETPQELVHRPHDVGMRVERAAREADVGRTVVAEALHQLRCGRTARRPAGRRRASCRR